MKVLDEKEAILKGLEKLHKKFNWISFSYVFDKTYEQHVIEVSPISAYLTEEFACSQIDLEMNLIDEFPTISTFFVPDGYGLALPEFEFKIPEK